MLTEALKKLAIGYIRVSTEGQADAGDSPKHQAAHISDYAFGKGFTLLGIYEEVASATPGKEGGRPVFLDVISRALREDAVLIVTKVDRLSRSHKEVNELIMLPGIRVHVVSLNRQIGKNKLLSLSKEAEAEGAKISQDTKTGLGKMRASNVRLGAPKSVLEKATRSSSKQRAIAAWNNVLDIVKFISADPLRRDMTRRELADELNDAGINTTRGNAWTKESVTRPRQKAMAQLKLEDEPDDSPPSFDDVQLA